MPRKLKRKPVGVTGTRRTTVELLLTSDVPHLGKHGDIVRVRPGYARNYLIPQGLATVATEHNKRMVELHRQKLEELRRQRLQRLRELAKRVADYSVTLEANATPEGHLYGSIGAADIAKALQAAGFEIQPEHICLEGPLKVLGKYTIKLQLEEDITSEVKVWVVPPADSGSH
ncbi:MAG: 50S ribosomal protein L9 [Planctomycetota bacterium]|nr:MAG: 50S ribosomal protein L9 [Planctomycetota bacterium]